MSMPNLYRMYKCVITRNTPAPNEVNAALTIASPTVWKLPFYRSERVSELLST